MPHTPLSARVRADLIFYARESGYDDHFDTVQWQMPNTVLRLFQAEARRRKTDLNSLLRDFVCEALTERAEAIRRLNEECQPE